MAPWRSARRSSFCCQCTAATTPPVPASAPASASHGLHAPIPPRAGAGGRPGGGSDPPRPQWPRGIRRKEKGEEKEEEKIGRDSRTPTAKPHSALPAELLRRSVLCVTRSHES